MVVGNGLMAKAFQKFNTAPEVLIFASGVSDSTTTDTAQFKREFTLLKKNIQQHPHKRLVYFSTTSMVDATINQNPYVLHKKEMEAYIQASVPSYLIVRLSNVVGPEGNVATILNYLVQSINNQTPIQLWQNAERNFIDKDDVVFLVSHLLLAKGNNAIVNIANPMSVSIIKVVHCIEAHLNKKGIYTLIDKGNPLHIAIPETKQLWEVIEKEKGSGLDYVDLLLKKYYAR